MVALIVALTVVVALLGVLVAGLLRSHADILRALHSLGAGVGDPAVGTGPLAGPEPLTIGPPLPGERSSASAPTIGGVTPGGDALAISVATAGHLTLLAFLSSGCATCKGFWQAFARNGASALPGGVELVIVTKGPDHEMPADVPATASGTTVVMSSDAWTDYEVPGSPFFVLVDGTEGRRIGEGVANHFSQVVDLVRRARLETNEARRPVAGNGGGPERERANDRELLAAGILPGDPSLYPASLADVFGPARTHAGPDIG